MSERIIDRARLEAAMDHAIGAFLIPADAVGIPVGRLHQLLEARRVAFAEKIAGPLPAENRSGRIAPRRAMVRLISRQEIKEQGRLIEGPLLPVAPASKNFAEQLFGAGAVEEVFLVRSALIGVARRNGDAFDAEPFRLVEKGGDPRRLGAVE